MGAYAPAPAFTPAIEGEVMARIVRPTLAAMAARGTPFQGVLFAGLMLTAAGPKLIEYNVRFGDPECEVLMLLLESDLVELLLAAATGALATVPPPRWKPGAALTVVIAARGYPGTPVSGGRIAGLAEAEDEAFVFHAGTGQDAAGNLVARGGRVLAVTAAGADVAAAAAAAYRACARIDFPDGFWRRDIGWRAVGRGC
jgi:phosphoribosylamine--glycine ligase